MVRAEDHDGGHMPTYLFRSQLTDEGLAATLAAGGSERRAVVAASMQALGGRLESFYYASGGTEVWAIAELPDQAAAIAGAAAAHTSGLAIVELIELISPAVMDDAARRTVEWEPPGS